MRNCILFTALFAFVLLVNSAVVTANLFYAEQPMLFAANQTLHSFTDLFNIYWHPKMLDIFSIPFFRPSGHFLMYQLLMPLLGWHNTQGLIIVNLFFLAAMGFLFIKIYERLFPSFKVGAYLAFGIYLMHPALILSRLIALHFEFAYVFFTLLSFYFFMRFCQERKSENYFFLTGSLFFYIVAVTFKEPALMLGPVLVCYFCLAEYRGGSLFQFFSALFHNRQRLQVLLLLTMVTLSLAFYLTLAWPTLMHPSISLITIKNIKVALFELSKNILGFASTGVNRAALPHAQLFWRELRLTPGTQISLEIFAVIALLGTLCLSFVKNEEQRRNRNTLFFLWAAAILFLILPVRWAMAWPWHLSLTLVFLSLLTGFSAEYLGQKIVKAKRPLFVVGLCLAIFIGWMTRTVNQVNVDHIFSRYGFAFRLMHNAVLHPPGIKDKLNANTVLVVEDSILHDGYALGNSHYPLFLMSMNFDEFEKVQAFSFLKMQPLYNGYLFKWAYLLPTLLEEVYPFEVKSMEKVPDTVIYNWLQHYHNIVCLGYDKEANWHDRTAEFKQNLLREKRERWLAVHDYQPLAAQMFNGHILYTQNLSLPDPQACQYICDQNVQCKGFTYEHAQYHYHSTMKCQFYDSISLQDRKFCATCIGFVKNRSCLKNHFGEAETVERRAPKRSIH